MNSNTQKNPRILIANDDGFDAKGIKILEEVAKKISSDVWVVAPDGERSASSHSLTITRPLRVNKIDDRHFTVDGTPTDCVLIAVGKILKDKKPDFVLSGINNGGNLSDDVTYSGTVAAAMEGTILGIPSIALSQCYNSNRKTFWKTAETFCEDVVRKILKTSWPDDVLINVNFPAVEPDSVIGMDVVALAKREMKKDTYFDVVEERIDPRGREYLWIGGGRMKEEPKVESDIKSVISGKIAITPISLDMTDRKTILELKKVFL